MGAILRFYLHKDCRAAGIRFYLHKEFRAAEMLQVSVQIPVDFETLEGKMGQSTGICSDTCRFDVLKMMFKS